MPGKSIKIWIQTSDPQIGTVEKIQFDNNIHTHFNDFGIDYINWNHEMYLQQSLRELYKITT